MKKNFKLVMFSLCMLFGTPCPAETNQDVIILDVRTPKEFKENHLIGSQNIDWNQSNFKERLEKLDKSKTYKLYCAVGGRAGKAMELMKDMGFKDIENLGGVSDASKKLKIACEGPKPC